ncbi:MAG: hypothetical protein F2574_02105 [Actinobacteria bacterium]|jgi:hypothetical protein|uniref:Unannotated protein n=1 Tax=freshwater metagenome TaxID=449393 RepID=A0A6J6FJ77_9ZZZZ|nr:hypothetical protein [Actinomycetota bacterium]
MTGLKQQVVAASGLVGDWFSAVYADLVEMAADCERELNAVRGAQSRLTEKHLRAIQPSAAEFLERHSIPEAAGIVLGPGIANDDSGAIEWWRRGDSGNTNRIIFTLSPDVAGFYDFVTYHWFADVVSSGKPAIQGPYLDYAGMDQYIMTSMVPLSLNGIVIGTAGCDTEIRALETVMMPILRQIPADAALVSEFDRIVVGNSGRFVVGNRVKNLTEDSIRVDIPGHDLGLQLVAAPRAHRF